MVLVVASRLLLGSIITSTSSEFSGGATKIPSGLKNPSSGTSGAGFGGSSLNFVPSAAVNSSFNGLNEIFLLMIMQ